MKRVRDEILRFFEIIKANKLKKINKSGIPKKATLQLKREPIIKKVNNIFAFIRLFIPCKDIRSNIKSSYQ